MAGENVKNQAYWAGGSFTPDIRPEADLSVERVAVARNSLADFVAECHRYYFGFSQGILGLHQQRARYEQIIRPEHRQNRISTGAQFPNAQQSPGQSTAASMTQGEFLDALQEGGAFEILQCKALIVLMYHLWDEEYRPTIADLLAVCPKQIQSDLMGDIRSVRILVIHKKSIVPEGFSKDLKFLEPTWDIAPGELKITYKMINAFMEQLNALRLTVAERCPDENCARCAK